MPLITYTECTEPAIPDKVTRDGVEYVKIERHARNVREGDLYLWIDMTGPSGTVGTYGLGMITDAVTYPAGRGRQYIPPWRRREFTVTDWRGTLLSFQVPTWDIECAPNDRLTVFRLAKPTKVKRSYIFPWRTFYRWHCGICDAEPIGPHGGIGWCDTPGSARRSLRRHRRRAHER